MSVIWVSVVSAVVSLFTAGGVLAAVFVGWGRLTQKLEDHTVSDETRFTEVSNMLTEIRTDIKDLLKRN